MKWEKITEWRADGYVICKLADGTWHAGYSTSFGAGVVDTFGSLVAAKKACAEHKKSADHIQAHLDAWESTYNPFSFTLSGWRK
jgi:hypothetical protein